MIRTRSFCLGLCLVFALSACGSNGSDAPLARNGAANTSAAGTANANSETPPRPADLGSVNSNTGTSSSAGPNTLPMTAKRRVDAMRSGANSPALPVDTDTVLRKSTRPAPENSEFSVALTDVVVERRVFRDHPVLSRVEKVTKGSASKMTLTTVDGRVIELDGKVIPNLSTASSASILKIARLDAAPSQPSGRKPGAANRN